MRIVQHCVYFPPEVGGLESHVYHLCRAFVERGHRVDVVTSRSRADLASYEVMAGIHVWRSWLPGRHPVGWATHALASLRRTRRLARGADVLHAQAFQSVPPCGLAGLGRSLPLVATFHTSHFLARAERGLWRPVLGALVRWPDHALAASREIADVAESLAPGVRVEALTNGVDTDLFRPVEPAEPRDRDPVVVVPRRLFRKNGVEYFVRALPAIAAEIPGVRAHLIGDGPEADRIRSLALRLGVDDRIEFFGARPHEEMPRLLSSADVAVFPSLMEATSVAALECMACRVPVAASRVGGLPEIVDEEVGALFRAGDPEDLARAVVQLLEREDLAALGRRARERVVERWSNDRLAERHLEVYRALVAGGSGAEGATEAGGEDGGGAAHGRA